MGALRFAPMDLGYPDFWKCELWGLFAVRTKSILQPFTAPSFRPWKKSKPDDFASAVHVPPTALRIGKACEYDGRHEPSWQAPRPVDSSPGPRRSSRGGVHGEGMDRRDVPDS